MSNGIKRMHEDEDDWADWKNTYQVPFSAGWSLGSKEERVAKEVIKDYPELRGAYLVSVVEAYKNIAEIVAESKASDKEYQEYLKLHEKFKNKRV